MPALKNKSHEKFAQLIVAGQLSQADCYRETKAVKKKCHTDPTTAAKLRKRPDITARIAELNGEDVDETLTLKKKVVGFLTGVLDITPNQADMDSPLCEIRYVGKMGIAVPFIPSKHAAAERLNKMHGWEKDVIGIEASEKVLEILGGGFK